MVVFSLFFAVVFLVFWVSFPQNRLPSLFVAVTAFLTGTVLALVRYVIIAEPRVHDYGRPLYLIALLFHVLPPLVLSTAVFFLCRGKGGPDRVGGWASWLLFALVPYSVIFALSPPEPGTVKALVLLPVLWVAVIVAAHFFVLRAVGAAHILLRILLAPVIIAVPFLGAAVYWAWFAKETVLLICFLVPLAAMLALHFLLDYRRTGGPVNK